MADNALLAASVLFDLALDSFYFQLLFRLPALQLFNLLHVQLLNVVRIGGLPFHKSVIQEIALHAHHCPSQHALSDLAVASCELKLIKCVFQYGSLPHLLHPLAAINHVLRSDFRLGLALPLVKVPSELVPETSLVIYYQSVLDIADSARAFDPAIIKAAQKLAVHKLDDSVKTGRCHFS